MTDEEKTLLIDLLEKSITSTKKLKFDYLGHATSFGEAMYLKHIRAHVDDELNDLLKIDKKYLKEKIDKRMKLLETIIFKVKSL